ncbi:MAG: SRPBCC family protein [Ilumatobacteraceae bacterium]
MATITTDIHLDAEPSAAWDAVRDFGAVHERVAAGFVVASRLDGRDRIIRFANGAEARERLVTADDERWRLVYSVVEGPLDLRHHQASVEVMDDDGGGTRFVWTTDVLPDDAAPTIEAMMAQGASAIARTIGR